MKGFKIPFIIGMLLLIGGIGFLVFSLTSSKNKSPNIPSNSTETPRAVVSDTTMPIASDYTQCIISKDIDEGESNENNKIATRFNLEEVISVDPPSNTIVLSKNGTQKTWTLDETYRRSIIVISDLEAARNGVATASEFLSKEENFKMPQFLSLLKPGDLAEVSDIRGISIACLNK